MNSLLQQLENNEAILLMYLADELEVEDRAEVEHMLAEDAGLREEYDRLRATQEAILAQVERESRPLAGAAASRQFNRMISQWQARQRVEATPQPGTRRLGRSQAWWAYPAAAAATILLGIALYTVYLLDPHVPDRQVHYPQLFEEEGIDEFEPFELAELLEWSFDGPSSWVEPGSLRDIERQVTALGEGDEQGLIWSAELVR